MKVSEQTLYTLIIFAVWSAISSAFSVPAATITLLVFIAIGLIGVLQDVDKFISENPEGTALDKLFGWATVIYVGVCTYPFTTIFFIYVAVELIGSVMIHQARKSR